MAVLLGDRGGHAFRSHAERGESLVFGNPVWIRTKGIAPSAALVGWRETHKDGTISTWAIELRLKTDRSGSFVETTELYVPKRIGIT
jgi:hypothetical protein